jgi:hypothetical protein
MSTKKIFFLITLMLAGLAGAYFVACTQTKQAEKKATAQVAKPERKIRYWADPMNPSYRSD